MSPTQWLNSFLASRGMERPDGRMLYGYRLSEAEYSSLREALSLASQFGRLDDVVVRMSGMCQLFVLYASEWWRREYAGGAWRWDPIIDSLGAQPEELSANARTECVIRGFSYWNHRPSGSGKKYFGAIVAHGGLPLKAIGKKVGKFSSVMSHSMRLAARYRWDQEQMAEAVAERAAEFPASLRRPEIYNLVARMMASVLDLKREYGLEGDSDPVKTLNGKDPEWQQRFPLPLDEKAAQALLAGLVREASQQVAVASSDIFVVERQLAELDTGEFELQSAVRCPKMVDAEALEGLLRHKNLPRYFNIDIQLLDRQPLIDARQVLGAESATISFAQKKRIWRGEEACHDHALHVRDVSGDLLESALAIPGGEELSLDDPWIFVSRDGKNRFVACGGGRVPENEALVAMPAGWRGEPSTSDSEAVSVGQCRVDDVTWDIVRISGDAILRKNDQQYRIRTRQATGDQGLFVWEGRRLGFPSVPQRVFVGAPALYRYTEDGERLRVSARDLRWFVAGTDVRFDNANLAHGPVDVFLMDGDLRVSRFRFVVLPPDAYLAFRPGFTASEGTIAFYGWGQTDLAVPIGGPNNRHNKVQGGDEIYFQAGAVPPESVALSMRWPRCAKELLLHLPFPSQGGHFYDFEGRKMNDGEILPISKLLGARLRIFDSNPQGFGHYVLHMNLVTNQNEQDRRDGLTIENKIPVRQEGIGEVRLIDVQRDIETLMGYSDDIDAGVELILKVGGVARASIRICRYEYSLERLPQGFGFSSSILAHLDGASLGATRVMACPLARTDELPQELTPEYSEGVAVGSWSVAPLDTARAPWLIYPAEDSAVFFRPTIWGADIPSHGEVDNADDVSDLESAVSIAGVYFRTEAITSTLFSMADDFAHPSWGLIEHLWDAFHHLPLSSLDVWRIVAKNPELAAAVLMRGPIAEDDLSSLACRMRDELGLVWELVGVHVWRECIDRMESYWEALLGKDEAKASFPIILKARLDRLAVDIPSLNLMFQILLYERSGRIDIDSELMPVVKAMSGGVRGYVNPLWAGADAMVQTLLFRVHNPEYEQWPEPGLLNEAIGELNESCNAELKERVFMVAQSLFWEIGSSDFKRSVANMPVLCALWSIADIPPDWWWRPKIRIALRKIRSFDPIWFELAFSKGLEACLALEVVTPDASHRVTNV